MDKKNTKILIIDDEQGIRELLSYELKTQGYLVSTASNGQEGVDKVKEEKYHLVISDVKMPKMDGIQTLEAIRKFEPDIEVIMATGYGTIETAVKAMKKGAYDFIQKPFNLDEIQTLIEKALEKAELKALVALYEASKAIFSALKIDDLLPVLVQLSLKLLKADDVSIMLLDEDKKLYVAASHGIQSRIAKNVRLNIGERVAGKIAEWKETTIIVGALNSDQRFSGIDGNGEIKSSLICPLLSKGEVLGVLCAARTKEDSPFNLPDNQHANIFASQISQAIDNARLYRELERKLRDLKEAYAKLSETQNELIQSEKLAAIGELASGVAHELNNPLTTIMGLIDLLLEDEGDREKKSGLTTVREQAERCRKIILNLLQFARKHTPEKTKVEINDILEKTLELLQYELVNSGVVIAREYDGTLPLVKVDIYQLQQVFLNIISNSRYAFMETEKPTLTLRTQKDGDKVVVLIIDNGCGIPAKNVGKIFDPFFTTKEVGKGTGLGLSISYGIIKEHGGMIQVESKENEGSTFRVELPVA